MAHPPVEFLKRLLGGNPSPDTLHLVLQGLLEAGEFRRTLPACLEAVRRHPDDLKLRAMLAAAYQELGFLRLAEEELQRLTATLDELAGAYKRKALLLQRQGKRTPAAAALRCYLAHRPEDREARSLLSGLEEKVPESPPQPLETKEEDDLQGLPELATPTLAEVYFNQGQIRAAADLYRRVLAEHPDDTASRRRLEELEGMLEKTGEPAGELIGSRVKAGRKAVSVLRDWLQRIERLRYA